MFLHLGNDISIRLKDIIAIHDYEIFKSGSNRKCLEKAKQEGCLVLAVGKGQQEKSLVITRECIYVSVISPLALKRRSAMMIGIESDQDSGIGA